eukprot:766543-Hanusia_phi.AAC.2
MIHLAEGGVASHPAVGLSNGKAAVTEGSRGELLAAPNQFDEQNQREHRVESKKEERGLHVGKNKELILLIVDSGLVEGTSEGLVDGGNNGVTSRVHVGTVEVSTGSPGDEDRGLPQEGEDILETLRKM